MATKRQTAAPALDGELLEIFLGGPWPVGRTLNTLPYDHETLRGVWRQHEAAIRAEAARRNISPWFPSRDWFVRLLAGDESPAALDREDG